MTAARTSFLYILTVSVPVAAAYVPLGAIKSVLMMDIGLDWYWPLITALVIYGGSAEYLMVSFLSGGLSLPAIAWSSLLINFRHLFYGLSYPVGRHQTIRSRLYGIFSLTDEAYVLISLGAGRGLDSRGLIRLQGLMQFWWFFGSALGVLVYQWIPASVVGFGFSLTAMFVILALDSFVRLNRMRSLLWVGVAMMMAFSAEQYWPNGFLVAGLVGYFVLLSLDFFVSRRRS